LPLDERDTPLGDLCRTVQIAEKDCRTTQTTATARLPGDGVALATLQERITLARMTAENKVQIVQTLDNSGRVGAMVGDPAQVAADMVTAAGSLAAMGTLISIPIVSQLLGCTPIGPVGWGQALGSAAAATVAMAVLNRVLENHDAPAHDEEQDQHSQSRPVPPAKAPRKARVTAHSAQRQTTKLAGRAGRRSSTYSRR